MKDRITADPSAMLRGLTPARIGLGRAGSSLPTRELLEFGLAHAQARDAVHAPLDAAALVEQLHAEACPAVVVHSAAADRQTYLRRPDLGRRLDAASGARLDALRPALPPEAIFVLADGLSARAVHASALAVLHATMRHLQRWRFGPVVVAEQSRVALGDHIGHRLGCELVAVLIGERPGLSAPDSLGIYLTYGPRPGRTDAERNCISNVRPHGLAPEEAALGLARLMEAARRLRLTGVRLKDTALIAAEDQGGARPSSDLK